MSVIRTLVLVACAACGGGVDAAVVDLSQESQTNLCEAFLDQFCGDPANATACGDACIASHCADVAAGGQITTACVARDEARDITVSLVEACAGGDAASCAAGGDCVLDALPAFCGSAGN